MLATSYQPEVRDTLTIARSALDTEGQFLLSCAQMLAVSRTSEHYTFMSAHIVLAVIESKPNFADLAPRIEAFYFGEREYATPDPFADVDVPNHALAHRLNQVGRMLWSNLEFSLYQYQSPHSVLFYDAGAMEMLEQVIKTHEVLVKMTDDADAKLSAGTLLTWALESLEVSARSTLEEPS